MATETDTEIETTPTVTLKAVKKLTGDGNPEAVAKKEIHDTFDKIAKNLQNHRIDFDMADFFMSVLREWNTTGINNLDRVDIKDEIDNIKKRLDTIEEKLGL